MIHRITVSPFVLALSLAAPFSASATITVTEPPEGETRITQGQDYAAERIGDA